MNYSEAEKITKDAGLYASPDFYRVMTSDKLALGLRDSPTLILTDVVAHGTDEARDMLRYAIGEGYVESFVDGEYTYYDMSSQYADTPPYILSHIAMQIAYPALYWVYFKNEHVWEPDDAKMAELADLSLSCLTDKRHPSDYFGEHEIPPEDEVKKGRPEKEKPSTSPKIDFRDWVAACKAYNHTLKQSWQTYQEALARRKEVRAHGKVWRDTELNRLRIQMSQISNDYKKGVEALDNEVNDLLAKHMAMKAQGKPKREDFK